MTTEMFHVAQNRFTDQIGPRRPYWRDWEYDPRLRFRRHRLWEQQIGYGDAWQIWHGGLARHMSGSVRDEIVKIYEQYTHLCSGLGEGMMHEIVRQYFGAHPERARGVYADEQPVEHRPYASPRPVTRATPRQPFKL